MHLVSTHEEGRRALREALGKGSKPESLQLISPPYAACHAGLGYYQALLAALEAEFPAQLFTFTLCCGDDAALAYEALRLGFSSLRLSAPARLHPGLETAARQQQAHISWLTD